MSSSTHSEPIVAFDRIEKSFFGVKVLKGVSFSVGAGRILGLVGENGAGKSTLMNLLGGNLQAEAGALRVDGRPYAPNDSKDARLAGIAFVHQELNLFPNLSIAENLHLTTFPLIGGVPWISRGRLRARTAELLSQVGLEEAPDTPVERLSAGERQLVEIAKALGAEARLIILDEPTTSLSTRECERLFSLLTRLRRRGIGMIFISHALGDVLRLCDDLVVLRDGEVVGSGPVSDFGHDRVVSLMVGRQLNQLYPERSCWRAERQISNQQSTINNQQSSAASSRPKQALKNDDWRLEIGDSVLQVRSLTQPGIVRDISFSLAAGEVLGIAGLMGAGRSELARILFGLDPFAAGEILLDGEPLSGRPRSRIQRGLAFLTEDRRQEGLCMEAAITDNIALVALPGFARTPARLLDFSGIRQSVGQIREAIRLSAKATDAQAVKTLSGGNQQKVVLAKWLLAKPRVLILDEPTRGIDVGAKFEIHQLIHQLADQGAGVLMISSEIEELIGTCDRILVMRRGEIAGEFSRDEFDRERILAAALHVSKTT